jgi:hypothetical protein
VETGGGDTTAPLPTETMYRAYDLNSNIPVTVPPITVLPVQVAQLEPPSGGRVKRASAARAGALWNTESIAAGNKAADAEVYVSSGGGNAKKTKVHKEKKSSKPLPLPAVQLQNNKLFAQRAAKQPAAQIAAAKKKKKKKKTRKRGAEVDASDDDFVFTLPGMSKVQGQAALMGSAQQQQQQPVQRESRRERQKPAALRDPDMLDPDAALLLNPEYADKPTETYAAAAEEVTLADAEMFTGSDSAAPPSITAAAAAAAAAEMIEEPALPNIVAEEEEDVLEGVQATEPVQERLLRPKRSVVAAKAAAEKSAPKKKKKKAKRVAANSQVSAPEPKKRRQSRTPTPPTTSVELPVASSLPTTVADVDPTAEAEAVPPPQLRPVVEAPVVTTDLPYQQPSIPPHTLTQDDFLLGCNKCRYTKTGCGVCRSRTPAFTRPPNRWNPFQGHHQVDIPAILSFRPTEEEFKDPVAYITKIMPEATKYGLAHIIPPAGWDPPFALEKGTNGVSMESFKFSIRKQLTSHLCYRSAPMKNTTSNNGGGSGGGVGGEAGGVTAAAAGDSRYGKKKQNNGNEPTAPAAAGVVKQEPPLAAEAAAEATLVKNEQEKQTPVLTADDILAALAAANSGEQFPDVAFHPIKEERKEDQRQQQQKDVSGGNQIKVSGEVEPVPINTDFGFVPLEKKQTLRSFASYADWVKAVHFSDPPPLGKGISSAPSRRPLKILPVQHSAPVEPSVEEIEAEFWRIVETPDTYLESLYGQDLDSGHHGSGFPLPEWRRRLLETHLTVSKNNKISASDNEDEDGHPPTTNLGTHHNKTTQLPPSSPSKNTHMPAPVELPPPSTDAEKIYSEHPWNINNMPRSRASMLRYLLGDGLITGVMVPWLYVGSCLSAFCWHVEDHALYSVNYLHMGAPKIWYGVPADATLALEEAMKDALPHLFESNPGLLHQLVTTLSPMELMKRGVPVHRVVHEAGSFIVTMPDAYHSGFNTGFNCAEAVNFAAPGWIPFGTDISQKYRDAVRPVTMSHDSLLVALATAAQHVVPTKKKNTITTTTTTLQNRDSHHGIGYVGGEFSDQKIDNEAAPTAADVDGNAANTTTTTTADAGINNQVKQANGFGPLGDIPWADAPLDGIILGTGELALRAAEEKERWAAGAEALIQLGATPLRVVSAENEQQPQKEENGDSPATVIDPSSTSLAAIANAATTTTTTTTTTAAQLENVLPCRTMDPCTSNPGSKDPVTGMYEDTAECDCQVCQGDLWLAAVVSSAAPGIAVCPEHAATLVNMHNCPLDSLVLLCRYSPSDLQQLVDVAVERIQGAEEAVVAAQARRQKLEIERVRAIPVGPLYPTNELGECIGGGGVPPLHSLDGLGGAENGAFPTEAVEPPSGKKRGRKPKKKRGQHFKKNNTLVAVDNTVTNTGIYATGSIEDPLPSLLPPSAPIIDTGVGNIIVEELVVGAPFRVHATTTTTAAAAAAAVAIRHVEPSSDVEMLMVSHRQHQSDQAEPPQQPLQQPQQPLQQQQRQASEAVIMDAALSDVADFVAVLDSEFDRRSNETSLALSVGIQNNNEAPSLQPPLEAAAGAAAAKALGGSTAPIESGLVVSDILASGRVTSISEVMPMDVDEHAVEVEVKEEDVAAAEVPLVQAAKVAEEQKEEPARFPVMCNLNSD